ncbi:MAG: cytidylate kinase-like family protein [Oscillospiraceae bacterium]|nr:cytidylate kinase-like family protein [Oscillospiraceae bacterium]
MKVITISREFGSGGRELGKRLADALHVPCHDEQIIEMIAQENGFDQQYVANVSESSMEAAYPMTIGNRFAAMPAVPIMDQPIRVAVAQRRIIEELAAKGDCVVVGRCADVILRDLHPLNLFVYADMDSKVRRCMERAKEEENLTYKEMVRKIKQVDKGRAHHRLMYDDGKWGAKECYHLCINTSGREIKAMVPAIAQFCKDWFDQQ